MKVIKFNDPVTQLHGKIRDIFPVSTYCWGSKQCYAQKHEKDLIKIREVRPGQDCRQNSDFNGRKRMVSIMHSGQTITSRIWGQYKIMFIVEVDVIECRKSYWWIRLKGVTDLIPPY